MLLGLLNELSLLVFVVAVHCVTFPERNSTLPALVQYDHESSLPVIVTATRSTSTAEGQNAGKPTENETTRFITTTNIVTTITTVLTTVSSQATQSTTSPSNALEILSAAERSFSLLDSSSSLPLLVNGHSQTVNVATNTQKHSHSTVPILATSNIYGTPHTSRQPTGDTTSRITSDTTSQAGTTTLSDQITSNGGSGYLTTLEGSTQLSIDSSASSTIVDPASARFTSSISTSNTLTTAKSKSVTAASSSMDVTAIFGNGAPQGTFTVPQAGAAPSSQKASRLKMAAAGIPFVIFLQR